MALGACDTLFAAQRDALALPYPGVQLQVTRRRSDTPAPHGLCHWR
ncbi:hypothetical protein BIS44_0002 [Mycobacterium tuberculosis variant bovis BCG]|nr:hypothetical protein BIS44_0002 [Mycobacterium tuberculosis variant bovis BCG]